MGVMLVLDGSRPARPRRRGSHTRTPEEQACLDAFAAFLRYDASAAGRCLSRLGPAVLAGKLRPAARALAEAVDLVLGEDAQWPRDVHLDFTVSPSCLLGHCRSGAGSCTSALCEHDCHVTASVPAARRAPETAQLVAASVHGSAV
jgi:hypothetical protein